ncbi:MAG TPA: sigma-70 family RNA polymerase sigma factor, partial [Polyangia bacterium]
SAMRPHIAGPDAVLEGLQLERVVQEGLAALEPEHREVLVLRDVENLSYDEIAAITGVAEGTVKSRLHRARLALKEHMAKHLGQD